MPYPGLLHPEPLPLHQSTAGDTQTQFCLSLCGISGSWCTQGLFESCGHLCQFDSKHEFMPPTIFLGLLLCPWMWGISSKSRQCWTTTTTAPATLLGLLYSESHSVVCNSLWPHPLYSPQNSPGQNTGVNTLSLLQGIFPTQGLNPGLPRCRRILYQLTPKGSPRILEWVAYPFSSRSFRPRNWTRVSCIAGRFFTNWAIRESSLCLVFVSLISMCLGMLLLGFILYRTLYASWTWLIFSFSMLGKILTIIF